MSSSYDVVTQETSSSSIALSSFNNLAMVVGDVMPDSTSQILAKFGDFVGTDEDLDKILVDVDYLGLQSLLSTNTQGDAGGILLEVVIIPTATADLYTIGRTYTFAQIGPDNPTILNMQIALAIQEPVVYRGKMAIGHKTLSNNVLYSHCYVNNGALAAPVYKNSVAEEAFLSSSAARLSTNSAFTVVLQVININGFDINAGQVLGTIKKLGLGFGKLSDPSTLAFLRS